MGGTSASGISGDKTQSSRGLTDYWLVKMGSRGTSVTAARANPARPLVGEGEPDNSPEDATSVLRATPNPFTAKVTLHFTLIQPGRVSLKVFNDQGVEVANLYEGEAEAGKSYAYEWRPGPQQAGMYIVRLATADNAVYRKIVQIR